jgi:hypothetical protein
MSSVLPLPTPSWSSARVAVSMAAGRAHRNPDLAGTRMRIGKIHDLENLRAPELAETHCPQHWLRSRLKVSRLLRVRQSASPGSAFAARHVPIMHIM